MSTMKTTRVFQLTALLLVVVSVVQVGGWVIDQQTFIERTTQDELQLYRQEARAAQALLDAGKSPDTVRELLPRVVIKDDKAEVSAALQAALAEEQHSRLNRYMWESGFFLLALGVCIAVISRALRAEARVLQEQDQLLALVSPPLQTPLASLQLQLENMTLPSLA